MAHLGYRLLFQLRFPFDRMPGSNNAFPHFWLWPVDTRPSGLLIGGPGSLREQPIVRLRSFFYFARWISINFFFHWSSGLPSTGFTQGSLRTVESLLFTGRLRHYVCTKSGKGRFAESFRTVWASVPWRPPISFGLQAVFISFIGRSNPHGSSLGSTRFTV